MMTTWPNKVPPSQGDHTISYHTEYLSLLTLNNREKLKKIE